MKHFYVLMFVFITTSSWSQQSSSLQLHITKNNLETTLHKTSETSESTSKDKEPQYMNFNPVISYESADDYIEILKEFGDLSQATVFTVYRATDVQKEREIWGIFGEESQITLTTTSASNTDLDTEYEGGLSAVPVLNTYTQRYKPKNKVPLSIKPKALIGNFSSQEEKGFQGVIAEILVFDRVLKGDKRQKIETMLALKYGITLSNDKDYISSAKTVIWNKEDNEKYNFNIAGIGRDDTASLYQKQAYATAQDKLLVMGLGEIQQTNSENKNELRNHNFLLWGDNNEVLKMESSATDLNRLLVLQRKWLIQATGEETKDNAFTLQFDTRQGFETNTKNATYLLVIDTSGTGDFLPENTIYKSSQGISDTGILTFSNITWDADGSGTDVFTFTEVVPLTLEISEGKPLQCDALNNGVISYQSLGGVYPLSYELTATETSYSKQWESSKQINELENVEGLESGLYVLKVTDALGTIAEQSYEIKSPTPIQVDLGKDRRLSFDGTTTIDASIYSEDVVVYQWTSDNGFSSTNALITVKNPGTYKVSLTSENGCTATDEIIISESTIQEFTLYPNHTDDGRYIHKIKLLSAQDVLIKIFDISGRLVATLDGKNKASYELPGHIQRQAGIYTVVLETTEGTATRKLVVE